MTARPVVWVTRRLPADVEEALAARFDVRSRGDDAPMGAAELQAAIAEADGVLCTVTDRVDAACFAVPGRRTRIVANFGVGVNHIDLAAATAAGVTVTNTPDVLTDDTADLAILLMLSVLRRASSGERELRAGQWTGWRPTHHLGRSVRGKTLGIVGFGRIGRAVTERAMAGLGMQVLAWTRGRSATALPTGVTRVETLEELLRAADVVSLHCPATPETRRLIGAAQFAQMRSTAVLVNTARGDVVDEAALVAALEAGRIAGAGLDVYEREPAVHPGLLGRDDVVLLPHLGSATVETRTAMGLRALENLDAFFAGRVPPDRVG